MTNQFCYLRDKLSVTDLPASLQGNDKDKAHNIEIAEKTLRSVV